MHYYFRPVAYKEQKGLKYKTIKKKEYILHMFVVVFYAPKAIEHNKHISSKRKKNKQLNPKT